MLQWMGGSRRKVTTSRKSTYKRQKQYFEQRKRQQQQTASLAGYADVECSYTSHNENNKSLDILSLANLTTVAEEHKTRNVDGNDSDEDDLPLNNQGTLRLPSIVISEGIPGDHSETDEERASLNYDGTGDEYSKIVPAHKPDHNGAIIGKDSKLDSFKFSDTHPVSVIDLLGDGGPNSNAEENPRHAQEAHVAFSIEGLGEVEAETPVHSPKISHRRFFLKQVLIFVKKFEAHWLSLRGPLHVAKELSVQLSVPDLLHDYRSFPHGFSPQIKSRQTVTSKHLDCDFDDFGSPVVDFSPNKCLIEQPFCSRDVMDIFDDPDRDFLNFRESSPFNWRGNAFCGDLINDELIYNIQDKGRNFCKGPNYLDNSMDDLGGGYEPFYENWLDPENVGFDNHYPNKDLWKQDIGWNIQKKLSSTKTTKKSYMREPPANNPKHHILEELPDVISDMRRCPKHLIIDLPDIRISDTRRCSALGISKDVKDSVDSYLNKDAKESLSLRSEESCSSTAVRGDTAKKS